MIKFLSSFWYLAFLSLATFCPALIFSNSISAFCCSSWNDGCLLLTSFTKLLFQPSTALLVRGRSFFTLSWQLHCSISNLGFCRICVLELIENRLTFLRCHTLQKLECCGDVLYGQKCCCAKHSNKFAKIKVTVVIVSIA